MRNNNWKVYIHTNLINDKKYVGITQQNPEDRWQNGNGYPVNEHFTSAIKKYGWNNFKHIILFDNLTQEEAENIEIELIAYHKSNNRKFGYNKDNGGHVGRFTEETKRKMSEIKKKIFLGSNNPFFGKHHTQKTIDKIKKTLKGKFKGCKNPFYGKHHSEETKLQISNSLKGRVSYNKGKKLADETICKMKMNSQRTVIQCVETGKIFNSMGECAKEMGLFVGNISKVCRGKIKHTGGFSFIIIKDYKNEQI